MSKKFNQLVAKFQKLNAEMLSELTGGGGFDSEDSVLIMKNWRKVVARTKKMPVGDAIYDDGCDLLGLADGGFEAADTLRSVKLFVELDNQRKFLAKIAPKAPKAK